MSFSIVLRRIPLLFHFAGFVQKRGCTEISSATAFVEEFVTLSLSQHAAEAKTTESLHKHRIFNESAVLQMLRLACGGAQGAIATAALFHSNPQSLGSLSICDVNVDSKKQQSTLTDAT